MTFFRQTALLLALGSIGLACSAEAPDPGPNLRDTGAPLAQCDGEELGALYEHYIEPFVSGAVPSSCSECHMTGIDVSIYAQDTPCQTMACMVEDGAADLSSPEDSRILEQIRMGSPASSVFDVETEHTAMLKWIEWAAKCQNQVCGDISGACNSGTGSPTTGRLPTGSCNEDDLLANFWDKVVADQGRCISCHDSDQAPRFLEDMHGISDFNNDDHKRRARNGMYAIITGGLIDAEEPLNSLLLSKPLQHGFQPKGAYGAREPIENVPNGVGVGVSHGGDTKINFECPGFDCSDGAIIDCRMEQACTEASECGDGMRCGDGYCRLFESVCSLTYINYLDFIQHYLSCQP